MKDVDWSSFNENSGSKGNGRSGISFLKFEANTTSRVRPIGRAKEFFKIFIEKGKPSIIVDVNDKEEAARMLSEETGREIVPNYRNAYFVLDRNDGNKVKIMEGGRQIFKQIAEWSNQTKIEPGSGQGYDWSIKATGNNKDREYIATPLQPAPLTADEKSMLEKLKSAGKLQLELYFKEVPLNKVIETVFGTSGSSGETASAAATGVSDDGLSF
jgi:hypothetical protein